MKKILCVSALVRAPFTYGERLGDPGSPRPVGRYDVVIVHAYMFLSFRTVSLIVM